MINAATHPAPPRPTKPKIFEQTAWIACPAKNIIVDRLSNVLDFTLPFMRKLRWFMLSFSSYNGDLAIKSVKLFCIACNSGANRFHILHCPSKLCSGLLRFA